MTTKKQHYIWRHYLKPWSHNDDKIFCLRLGKIFESNLMGIGHENYFYKMKQLNDNDIIAIEKLGIEKANSAIKEYLRGWITTFNAPFKLKERCIEHFGDSTALQEIFNKIIIEGEEKLHSQIEGDSINLIEQLQNGNIGFFMSENGRMDFCYFLSVQYFRTKKIKSNIINQCGKYTVCDIENIWNVLSHIFASSLAFSICFNEKFKIILLKNTTEKYFITGDQPVINMYAIKLPENTEAPDLEFYYPISPNRAILFTKNETISNNQIEISSVEEIIKYNKSIKEFSLEQIYGHTKEIIMEYM